MTSLESYLHGEILRGDAGMALGKIRVDDAIRDGIVLVERKVWTWREVVKGREYSRTYQQDTWWYGTSTYDRRTGREVRHLIAVTEQRGRFFVPIRTEAIGPVEMPRPFSDHSATHAHWAIIEGREIKMRIGFLEVDISGMITDDPWFA